MRQVSFRLAVPSAQVVVTASGLGPSVFGLYVAIDAENQRSFVGGLHRGWCSAVFHGRGYTRLVEAKSQCALPTI